MDSKQKALILVENIVKKIIENNEGNKKVKVFFSGDAICIQVPEGEQGKVIGKKGRIINSLRTLVRARCSFVSSVFVEGFK